MHFHGRLSACEQGTEPSGYITSNTLKIILLCTQLQHNDCFALIWRLAVLRRLQQVLFVTLQPTKHKQQPWQLTLRKLYPGNGLLSELGCMLCTVAAGTEGKHLLLYQGLVVVGSPLARQWKLTCR